MIPRTLNAWRKQQILSPLECRDPPAGLAEALSGGPCQHQRRRELHFVPRRLALAAALIQDGEPHPALGVLCHLRCSRIRTGTQKSAAHSGPAWRAAGRCQHRCVRCAHTKPPTAHRAAQPTPPLAHHDGVHDLQGCVPLPPAIQHAGRTAAPANALHLRPAHALHTHRQTNRPGKGISGGVGLVPMPSLHALRPPAAPA
jgi:hypothetical protein